MEKGENRHIPIEVHARPLIKFVDGITDIVESRNEEIRELKDEHRGVLKEIREALDTIQIFSSDSLGDHREACRTINDILEDNGV